MHLIVSAKRSTTPFVLFCFFSGKIGSKGGDPNIPEKKNYEISAEKNGTHTNTHLVRKWFGSARMEHVYNFSGP